MQVIKMTFKLNALQALEKVSANFWFNILKSIRIFVILDEKIVTREAGVLTSILNAKSVTKPKSTAGNKKTSGAKTAGTVPDAKSGKATVTLSSSTTVSGKGSEKMSKYY